MRLHIKNLSVNTIIGAKAEERLQKREVIINVWLELETDQAVERDALEDSVDYKDVSDRIFSAVECSRFKLIESLAHHILAELATYSQLTAATVEVTKPSALRRAESVSVTASWERAKP